MFKRYFFLTANSITCPQLIKGIYQNFSLIKESVSALKKELANFLETDQQRIFILNSGKMGLYLALKSLNIKESDEIILPGYTCVVVSNAVKYIGATAKYADISYETLNIDTRKLEKLITPKTKAIVTVHNFGIPYDDVLYLKEKYPDIPIIEDCAHALGSKFPDGRLVGTKGDFSFFSLEYSKPITSGVGGILVVNNSKYLSSIQDLYTSLPKYPILWEVKILLTLSAILLGNDLGNDFLKRGILYLLRKLGLKFASSVEELQGKRPAYYPSKMNQVRAFITYLQLKDIKRILKIKQKIAELYFETIKDFRLVKQYYHPRAIYVRYPLLLPKDINKEKVLKYLRGLSPLEVGEWFNDVIHPTGSYRYCYTSGMCPVGEDISRRIINLPINIRMYEHLEFVKTEILSIFKNLSKLLELT